jgi:hypothetical protein
VTGSMADQLSLLDAYDGYCRAARLAKWLNSKPGWDNEDARYLRLIHVALRCGYVPNTKEICRDWAAKRVETIRRTFPNHVKEREA